MLFIVGNKETKITKIYATVMWAALAAARNAVVDY